MEGPDRRRTLTETPGRDAQAVRCSGRERHKYAIINSTLSISCLMRESLVAVDQITAHRHPEPSMEAMYLLMSTTQNIDRIIRDFSGQQMYAGAHLFFTDRTFQRSGGTQ